VTLLLSVLPPAAAADHPDPPWDGPSGEVASIRIQSDAELQTAAITYGWSGNGSADDPFVIEGMDVNGSTKNHALYLSNLFTSNLIVRDNRFHDVTADTMYAGGTLVLVNCWNVTVVNNTFEDSVTKGVYVESSTIRFLNNTIADSEYGLYTLGSRNSVTASGNSLEGCLYGIIADGSLGITNNTVIGTGGEYGYGIYATTGPGLVAFNRVSDCYYGIRVGSSSIQARNNTIRNSSYAAFQGVARVLFDGNVIEDSPRGIWVLSGGYIIRNNTFTNAAIYLGSLADDEDAIRSTIIDTTNMVNGRPVGVIKDGRDVSVPMDTYGQVILVGCSRVSIENSTPTRGPWMDMAFCDNITVAGNHIVLMNRTQWVFCGCEDASITGNDMRNVSMELRWNHRLTVSNNSIVDGPISVYIGWAIRFLDNTLRVTRNEPLSLYYMIDGEVLNNEITLVDPTADMYAIRLYPQDLLVMRNNSLHGAGISNPWATTTSYNWDIDIDSSNTVNGRPVLFLFNVSDLWVTGEYGQVTITHSSNVYIDYLEMGRGDGGINLLKTHDSVIDHCVLKDATNVPVTLYNSNNVSVTNCLFEGGNSRLYMRECSYHVSRPYSTISGNYFIDIAPASDFEAAIELSSTNVETMTGNYVNGVEGFGVYSTPGYFLSMGDNEIANCTRQAIYGWLSSGTVHHNVFIDNALDPTGSQVMDHGMSMQYDDGSAGNYWSDYTTRYPGATNDGAVWDTPYEVDGEDHFTDRFPLVDRIDRVPPWARILHDGRIIPGTPATFTAEARDNRGVTAYEWTFIVGTNVTNMTGREVEFTFDRSGVFTVLLRVRDAAGNSADAAAIVDVLDNIPPIADAGPDITVVPGTTVTLDASSSWDDKGITTYNWSFDYDGSPRVLKGALVQFTFDVPGTYRITLSVTDLAGNLGQDVVNVTVEDTVPPRAVIGPDKIIPQRAELRLSGLDSSDNWRIDAYQWTVTSPRGNVTRYSTPEITHTFVEAGVHTVTLRVTDGAGLWDETSINVTARDITSPTAVAGQDVTIGQFEPLQLDGTASSDNEGIVNWTWTIIGPGGERTLYGPTHEVTFTEAGHHTIVLTVTDGWDNIAAASFTVTVVDTEPPVAVAGDDVTVDQGATVDLDGSASTDNVDILEYKWTLTYDGRDVERSGPFLSFTFEVPGVYTVTLSVSDILGNVGTDTVVVTVHDTEPPQAHVEDDLTISQHVTVTLDASASTDNVGITTFSWHIVGGDVDTTLDGTSTGLTFDAVGEYTVTLTVSDAAGNTATDDLTVTVLDADPPIAEAGPNIQVKRDETITLDGSASSDNVGVVSWVWTIVGQGVELTREGETVTLTLIDFGDYNVTLEVSDARGNTARDTLVLTVVPPPVDGHDEPDEEGISMVLVGGIAAAVIVVVLVVVLLVLRRKPGE